jgi:hypothetical protein
MSGVFGVVDPRRRVEARTLIDDMAARLSYREWYVAEWHHEAKCNTAFGRIGIGIFNRKPQPVWNASRTLALVTVVTDLIGTLQFRFLLQHKMKLPNLTSVFARVMPASEAVGVVVGLAGTLHLFIFIGLGVVT